MATTIIVSGQNATKHGKNRVFGTAPLSTSEESLEIQMGQAGIQKVQLISDVAWFWHDETGKATNVMCPVAAFQPYELTLTGLSNTLYIKTATGTGNLRVVRVF